MDVFHIDEALCLFVQTEAADVIALCEVQGMDLPLVLSIVAPKARSLSVSYALPDSW